MKPATLPSHYRETGAYRSAWHLCLRYRLILKEQGGTRGAPFSLYYMRARRSYTDVMHYADAWTVAELLAACQAYGAECEAKPDQVRHHAKTTT